MPPAVPAPTSRTCRRPSPLRPTATHPFAVPGISTGGSSLVLVRTLVFGGRALMPPGAQAPAIDVVSPGGLTMLTAGSQLVGGGTVAFQGSGTDLVFDSPTALVGTIAGNVRTTVAQVPGLAFDAFPPRFAVHYFGMPGDAVALLASATRPPLPTPIGPQWIDPATVVVLDLAVTATGERTVPAGSLSLSGLDLQVQALVLRGGRPMWSTPLAFVTP